jgi:hypothetical protein
MRPKPRPNRSLRGDSEAAGMIESYLKPVGQRGKVAMLASEIRNSLQVAEHIQDGPIAQLVRAADS